MSDAARQGAGSQTHTRLVERAAKLARTFGHDREFSRGGGGNVSVKTDGVLYIKPSGVGLGSLSAGDLMPLDMEPLTRLLGEGSDDDAASSSASVMSVAMAARLRPSGDQRPSVEVLFHALIPGRFVLHTHPTIVNAVCCAVDGATVAHELFGDAVLWVPYVNPGLPLARAIERTRILFEQQRSKPAPDVLLLQSHGLIAGGDEASAVSAASRGVVDTIRGHLAAAERGKNGADQPPDPPSAPSSELAENLESALRTSLSGRSEPKVVVFDASPDALRVATLELGRRLVLGGPITPDQIVYTGSWPLWLEMPEHMEARRLTRWVDAALVRHVEARRLLPTIVVVAGLGVFAAADSAREAETARDVYLDAIRIGFGASRLGGVRVLEPEERRFIEEWEAEAYRRGVAAAGAG
ncbi:MAG: class II aldolase [Chloroflexi bacterium]|nr:MAG: class II aldolase [Chloroflexota bacterium]